MNKFTTKIVSVDKIETFKKGDIVPEYLFKQEVMSENYKYATVTFGTDIDVFLIRFEDNDVGYSLNNIGNSDNYLINIKDALSVDLTFIKPDKEEGFIYANGTVGIFYILSEAKRECFKSITYNLV